MDRFNWLQERYGDLTPEDALALAIGYEDLYNKCGLVRNKSMYYETFKHLEEYAYLLFEKENGETIFAEFECRLRVAQVDLPPEFSKVVDDHFFDLLAPSPI